MVSSRAGFSLVETIVAVVLLTIGVLGAVATALQAMGMLREAESRHSAVALAGALLDSLSAAGPAEAGERQTPQAFAAWTGGGTLVLRVTSPDGDTAGVYVLAALPPLVRSAVPDDSGAGR